MFIQIFSVLGIIIILVHLLVFFIFPKTYLETRKEEVYNKANEISSIMNGKEIKYIEQTLELYSKSSEIKAFIKERNNNNNEIKIKDNIDTNLADGYIEKPFSLPVLKVRIDSLIKKNYGHLETFEYKDLSVNFNSYTAKINDEEIDVNAKELDVLKCLLDNNGQVLTRMQIIDYVWKDSEEIPYDRVIDVYIKELRKKLQLDCITTIRNVGYKLEIK